MQFITVLQIAFDQLRTNRLRTILTLIGIIIGVGAVVAILLIGESGRADILGELDSESHQVIFLQYEVEQSEEAIWQDTLTKRDLDHLQKTFGTQLEISSIFIDTAETVLDQKTVPLDIEAVSPAYANITTMMDIAEGNFFDEEKDTATSAVINDELAGKLYSTPREAIDQIILINRIPFTIKGVYRNSGLVTNDNQYNVYVPIDVWHQVNYHTNQPVNGFEIKVNKDVSLGEMEEEIVSTLAEFKGAPSTAFETRTLDEEIEMVESVLGLFTTVISSVAAISLIVGGIGVMNIMLVTVIERTREIGIRKAVGAKPYNILIQFLIETTFLTTIGGIIGCIFGLLTAYFITMAADMSFVVYWEVFLIAFGITTLIGLFSGIYPAKKASALDPIESLRHE